MLLGLNNIQIIGNLGNGPETRQLSGNNGQVVNFSVAVNERWKNREGEPQERTTWLRIVAFNGLAQACPSPLNATIRSQVVRSWGSPSRFFHRSLTATEKLTTWPLFPLNWRVSGPLPRFPMIWMLFKPSIVVPSFQLLVRNALARRDTHPYGPSVRLDCRDLPYGQNAHGREQTRPPYAASRGTGSSDSSL